MTKNMHREMIQREMIRRLQREKRLLAIQREALILFSLGLVAVLGVILIAI
jgi:hypothetical protein